jgi:uncharacterized protein (TIGR03083 family)
MVDVIPMIQAERGSLAEFLGTLTPEQWAAQSWCDKWKVQEVVGHLVAAANVTAGHFFPGLVMSGFSFDRFVDKDLRQYAAGTPAEVEQRFDGIINSTRTPPGPKYVALGEVMVHGEDIRRPLGAKGDHPAEHLVTLAEAYKKTGVPLRAKKRLAGLKLTATDVDWSTGDGPEISGPAMSLILAMVGRAQALDDCTGPGVETLRQRA